MRTYPPSILLVILAVVTSPSSFGDVVFSAVHNVPVPATLGGVYIDFTDPNNPDAFTMSGSEPATWDLNPLLGGGAVGNSATLQFVTASTATNADLLRLGSGATIGPAQSFPAADSGSTGHMGTDPDQFTNGQTGLVGFRLDPSSFSSSPSGPLYGYASVTFRDDGSVGSINRWAWDTSGAAVTIPEASGSVLLMTALSGFLFGARRRRRTVPGV